MTTETMGAAEPRSAFGEALTEIMAARGRKTDDDAIIQLGEEAGLDPRDAAGGFNIRALLDLARSDDARRPGSIPRKVSDLLDLSGAERQRLGYAYAYARRHPEHRVAVLDSAFRREVERLMAERGIETLADLHSRFMAQEPERIGNARWTYERFLKHVNHEVGTLDPRFIVPLTRGALKTKPTEEARLFLAWVEDATGRLA